MSSIKFNFIFKNLDIFLYRFLIVILYSLLVSYSFKSIASKTLIEKKRLKSYLNSIVSIDSKIPKNARTAEILGTFRQGSGVIIDNKNILTIGYIVIEASEIVISFYDGKKIPGKLTGYDHETGFGIISPIVETKLNSLSLGDSDKIGLDDLLFILPSFERGVGSIAKMVSRRPFVGWWEYYLENPIYTIPINQGWAGAPLVNSNGEILGIGSLYVSDSAIPGVISPGNMFVPINIIKPILNDLKKYGQRKSNFRPYIGLSSNDISGKIIVTRISKDGPSEKAGIKVNDVIISVNKKSVKNLKELYKIIWENNDIGQIIDIEIKRKNQNKIIKVKSINRMDYFIKGKSF